MNFIQLLVGGVVAMEQTFAHEIPGTSKKQIVLDMIQAGAKIGEAVPVPAVELISALIDSTVASLKAAGIFTSKPPAAPVPAPAA